MVAAPPPPPSGYSDPYNMPQNPKRRPGWLIPTLIAVGVILVLFVVAVAIGVKAINDKDEKPVVVVPTVSVSPSPEVTVTPTVESSATVTQEPTPEQSPVDVETPSYVVTQNKELFIQVVRDSDDLTALRGFSDDQIMTLGVLTCRVLVANKGDVGSTLIDLRKASDNKLSIRGAGALIGASYVSLCPTVDFDMSSLQDN